MVCCYIRNLQPKQLQSVHFIFLRFKEHCSFYKEYRRLESAVSGRRDFHPGLGCEPCPRPCCGPSEATVRGLAQDASARSAA